MGCDLRPHLEDFAAGRLKPGAALEYEAHMGGCAGCREELARVRAVRAVLAAHVPPEPTELDWARLDRRVLGALAERAAPSTPRLRDLLPALALGALASALLSVWFARAPSAPQSHVALAPPGAAALAIGLGPDALAQGDDSAPLLLESEPLVRAGTKLYSGTGSISLQTAPATGFHLAAESQCVLERQAGGDTSLRLLDGLLLAEVKPLGARQRFRVRSGDLHLEVRGTAFAVERRAGFTAISVVHGQVEVGRDGERTRLLEGPATLTVADGAALPEPAAPGAIDERLTALFPLSFPDATVESVLGGSKLTRLHSQPEGAEVWVGGAFRGSTPVAVLLPPGHQSVQLRAPGRPELTFDLDSGIQALELAALPPIDLDRVAAQRGVPSREQLHVPSAMEHGPARSPEGSRLDIRSAMQLQVRTHMDDLVRCYERALKRNPTLAGRLMLVVAIDPSGAIRDVSAPGQRVDRRFLGCASASIRGWSVPGTGSEESVQIPINLSRAN